MQDDPKHILLIVPCYNEEKNIPLFVAEAASRLAGYDWEILFVNDGSRDASWQAIQQESSLNPRVHGICFARNFGHQNALKAGLEEAALRYPADAYITLDADLQHPIALIPDMLQHMQNEKVHIVQAQRLDAGRKISLFKKLSSSFFLRRILVDKRHQHAPRHV